MTSVVTFKPINLLSHSHGHVHLFPWLAPHPANLPPSPSQPLPRISVDVPNFENFSSAPDNGGPGYLHLKEVYSGPSYVFSSSYGTGTFQLLHDHAPKKCTKTCAVLKTPFSTLISKPDEHRIVQKFEIRLNAKEALSYSSCGGSYQNANC